ncbi:hypothetical protein QFC19_008978 [Naganishia cerealis]|uniref:Uncharacterized protein n=1 Tax=Naganishia cerealis TaxID=610337 RepID=A0ACC2UXK2_9TREE|nr:hypothetical protein QFC19_008978 [Naganishia cerealis]
MFQVSKTLRNALSGLESLGAETAALPTGKFLPPAFNRIVLDAAIAQPSSTLSLPSSTPSEETSVTVVRAPNPFVGNKNPKTGRYAPPRISLRRQADLAKIYPAEYLPSGPKTRAEKPASNSATETIHYEEDRLAVQWVGAAKPLRKYVPKSWRAAASDRQKETTNEALRSGPYVGRQHQPSLFKGHKHDRQRVERREETKTRMEGMEGRIADWRKVRHTELFTC